MPRRSNSREIPKPPIGEVLKELGASDVPFGYGWLRMRCPFCEDRNGSASVNHDVNGFCCHQCGRKGDGLKLLQTELRLTFREAAERAEQLGGFSEKSKPKRKPSDLLKGMQ